MSHHLLPRSGLLITQDIRIVSVELAVLVGLNEAMMLQQLWYWLERSDHVHDGQVWVYNTYEDWAKQMPWWSARTIQRAVLSLERDGLIIARSDLNAMKIDKTKWYTIDFNALEQLRVARPWRQFGTSDDDNVAPSERANLALPLPEITPEITQGGVPIDVTLEDRLRAAADPSSVAPRAPRR